MSMELAEPVMALTDLPKAWLLCLSTALTAESAARLRTTCTLLQKVGWVVLLFRCCACMIWAPQKLLCCMGWCAACFWLHS